MIKEIFKEYFQKRLEKRNNELIEVKRQIENWKQIYFSEITFPILILDPKGYLAVSDLEEYYRDDDIQHYSINDNCKLLDSNGKLFTFRKTDNYKWIPDKYIAMENFESVKQQIIPFLFMPNHMQNIEKVNNFKSLIELLYN